MRKILDYKTENCLEALIKMRQAKELIKGNRLLIKDIDQDLANYCGVTYHCIKQIKKNCQETGLPLALKIAEYFNINIHDIFKLKNK